MRPVKPFFFLLNVLWLITSFTIQATAAPVIVTKEKARVFLTGNACSYYSTLMTLSPQQALLLFRRNKFAVSNAGIINKGIADSYYWIHFTILNKDNPEPGQVIEIPNPRLNNISLFEIAGNGIRVVAETGDFRRFRDRPVHYKNYIFPIDLQQGETKEYLLFVDQVGHTCTVPIAVYSEKYLLSNMEKDYLFDGIVYGLLLFVSITSLLFFISTHRLFYLYYSLYILTAIFWFFSYFGLGFQYLWPNIPKINTVAPLFFSSSNIFLNIQICQILLRIKDNNATLNALANVAKSSLAVAALFPIAVDLNASSYFVNHTYLLFFLSLIIFSVLIIIISVFSYSFKGLLEAKFYTSASFLKVLSIMNLALVEVGFSPALQNAETILQMGIIVEITLLTFALGRRYSFFKFKSYKLVVDAQENERYAISQEIHDGIAGDLIAAKHKLHNILANTALISTVQKQDLDDTLNIISNAYSDARSISRNIDPEYLRNHSLCDSINKYIDLIQAKSEPGNLGRSLKINCVSNNSGSDLSSFYKLNIYRIIQEAITNTIKHSSAAFANLFLVFNKNELHILFADNGIGITGAQNSNEISFKYLKSRVKILEGEFHIVSSVPEAFRNIDLEYNPKSLFIHR